MDGLIAVAVFGLLLLLVVAAILGCVATIRTGDLARRLERVERELKAQRGTQSTAPERSPSTAPAPQPPTIPVAPAAPAPSLTPALRQASPPPAPKPPPPFAAATISEGPKVPPPAAPLPERASAAPRIEWERWIGVRGAAVLGGVFLIVAGFLFLQYSIDRGWLTPQVRLLFGGLAGAAALIGAHPLRQRGYTVLSNSLSGAGIVLLYGVAWAAHRLYGVVGFWPAFAGMVAVTCLCAWLAHRHASQLIAVLGLLGGFATPLVLSTGVDRPLGLFGYALLLDFGFLFVAHRRRWPLIGMLALVGSFVLQGIWIALRMQGPQLAIGIGALLVFGLVFASFTAMQPAGDRQRWVPSQIGAVFMPFCFAIYFAQRVDFGFHLAPLALLAGVMIVAGGVLGILQRAPALFFGSALGGLLLVAVWTVSNAGDLGLARGRELVLCALSLGVLEQAFAEWERRRRPESRSFALAATVGNVGLLISCGFACAQASEPSLTWWLAALVLLQLLLLRLHAFGVHMASAAIGAFAISASLAFWSRHAAGLGLHPGLPSLAASLLGVGVVLLATARLSPAIRRRGAFFAIAAYFPLVFVALSKSAAVDETKVILMLGALLAVGLLLAAAATGARSSLLFAVAIALTAWAHLVALDRLQDLLARSGHWPGVMATLAASAALFTIWPFLVPSALALRAGVWRAAAVASLPWFLFLHSLWLERLADKFGFAIPLAFAAVLGACAWRLWSRGVPEQDAKSRALETDAARAAAIHTASTAREWFGAVALLLASFVIPLHFDPQPSESVRHPIAVGAAIYALALAAWWRKCDHRGLKYLSALAALGAAEALLGSAMFGTHASALTRVFNAQGYWLLLPAAATLIAARLMAPLERERLRGFELQGMPRGFPLATAALATCGILLAFAWLNLEVADAFGETPTIRWSFHGEPRVNLAQSIAWALFALVLLACGVSRALSSLRWASLFLLLITIAKVFLFDLAHLRGLYRVASMLGLALALLLVSFLYQRFVFKRTRSSA